MKSMTILLSIAAVLSGCSQDNETTSNIPDQVNAEPAKAFDAEGITNGLKAAGLPLEKIVVVTPETDDNNLMGRPGGYISKTYFSDSRYPDAGIEPDKQNTVEVFASEADATKRRQYIEGVTEGIPMFTQYIIQSGTAVVRLDKSLKPDEAKAYEEVLRRL